MSPCHAILGDNHRRQCRVATRCQETMTAIDVALLRDPGRQSPAPMSPCYAIPGDNHPCPCRLATRCQATMTVIDVAIVHDQAPLNARSMSSVLAHLA